MEAARLQRLVSQHAETAKLMGVDFVPAYRRPGSEPAPVAASPEPVLTAAPEVELKAAPGFVAEGFLASVAPDHQPLVERPRSREPKEVQRCLDLLRARYEADAPHQHFVTDHHSIVFGDGDPCAQLVFVGEAPGEEEDKQGIPFVGRAGQLLNKMIDAMGLSRKTVYICNVLKTRPPNNATPTLEEARLCAPYLIDQIRIINPKVIVTLGLPATKTVLGVEDSMARLRGRLHPWAVGGSPIPVIPTYHPAFLLRAYTPDNRKKVWSDLQMAMDLLGLKAKSAAGEA